LSLDEGTFKRRRVVVDELHVDVADNGSVLFEFQIAVGHNDVPSFEVSSDEAGRLAEEILMCAGYRRAQRVARRILRWAEDVAEQERKDRQG